jgi:ribosomal protein L11 methyltransferase
MKHPALWQLSVVTNSEAEPAITRWLQEIFGPVVASYDDVETGVCTVMAFVEAKPTELPCRDSDTKRLLTSVTQFDPQARLTWKKLRREDWAESWKRHFKPLEIGARLLVKPSWSQRSPQRGQALVVLDPGMSFGTGQHPTTSFCLRQLAAFRQPGTAQSCLDIGTGSGILAIAAAKLGYAPVHAFDFDPEAVRVARQNLRSNAVTKSIRLTQQDMTLPPRGRAATFNLVCANLLADLLCRALQQVTDRVTPGGRLVIAGILQREFASVRHTYEAAGWRLVATRVKNEWQSGAFELKDLSSSSTGFQSVV